MPLFEDILSGYLSEDEEDSPRRKEDPFSVVSRAFGFTPETTLPSREEEVEEDLPATPSPPVALSPALTAIQRAFSFEEEPLAKLPPPSGIPEEPESLDSFQPYGVEEEPVEPLQEQPPSIIEGIKRMFSTAPPPEEEFGLPLESFAEGTGKAHGMVQADINRSIETFGKIRRGEDVDLSVELPEIFDGRHGKLFTAGLKSGLTYAYLDTAGAFYDSIGRKDLAEAMRAQAGIERAKADTLRPDDMVRDIREVEFGKNVVPFILDNLVEQMGLMAPMIVGSAITGGGAALPMSIAMETGITSQTSFEETGKYGGAKDVVAGVVAGALDSLLFRGVFGKSGSKTIREIIRNGSKSGVERIASFVAGLTKSAGLEGVTEALQGLIEKAPSKITNREWYTTQDLFESLNEGVIGALSGGVLGSVGEVGKNIKEANELDYKIAEAMHEYFVNLEKQMEEPATVSRPGDKEVGRFSLGAMSPKLEELRAALIEEGTTQQREEFDVKLAETTQALGMKPPEGIPFASEFMMGQGAQQYKKERGEEQARQRAFKEFIEEDVSPETEIGRAMREGRELPPGRPVPTKLPKVNLPPKKVEPPPVEPPPPTGPTEEEIKKAESKLAVTLNAAVGTRASNSPSVRSVFELVAGSISRFSGLAKELLASSDTKGLAVPLLKKKGLGARSWYKSGPDIIEMATGAKLKAYMHESVHGMAVQKIDTVLNIDRKKVKGKAYLEALERVMADDKADPNVKEVARLYIHTARELGYGKALFGDKTAGKPVKMDVWINPIDDVDASVSGWSYTKSMADSILEGLKSLGINGAIKKNSSGNFFVVAKRSDLEGKVPKGTGVIRSGGITHGSLNVTIKTSVPSAGKADLTQSRGIYYGLGNLHEFLAEAFSSENFQEVLHGIKDPNKAGMSLWESFVKAISQLLGISVDQESVLASVMLVGQKIAAEERKAFKPVPSQTPSAPSIKGPSERGPPMSKPLPPPPPRVDRHIEGPVGKKAQYNSTTVSSVFNLPEMVMLVKAISGDKLPSIVRKLNKALGLFRGKDKAPESGKMLLRDDIFIGPKKGEFAVKYDEGAPNEDEIQQKIDEILAENDLTEDDVIVRQVENTKRKRTEVKVYQKDSEFASMILSHEIGHWIDFLPQGFRKRGTILDRIAKTRNKYKAFLSLLPENADAIGLDKKQRSKLRNQAEKAMRAAHPQYRKDRKNPEFRKLVSEEYQRIVDEWAASQGQVSITRIKNELKKFTMAFKPFDDTDKDMAKYRYHSRELYADAFSGLITNPDLLKEHAPTFFQMWHDYMEDTAPDILAAYDAINTLAAAGKVLSDQAVREAMIQSHQDTSRAVQEANAMKEKDGETTWDRIIRGFVERYHHVLKGRYKEKDAERRKRLDEIKWRLDEMRYVSGESFFYLKRVDGEVSQIIRDAFGKNEKQGFTEFGLYLTLQRILSDDPASRKYVANPHGIQGFSTTGDVSTAQRQLDLIKKNVTPEQMKAIEKAAKAYRKIREETIIPRLKATKYFTQEELDIIERSESYVKFEVKKWLEHKHGRDLGTAGLYHTVGTLNEIIDPFYATIANDLSFYKSAAINEAKVAILKDGLKTDSIIPADMKFIGGRMQPQDPGRADSLKGKSKNWGIFSVRLDGKVSYFYAPEQISVLFTNPVMARNVVGFWSNLTDFMRALFVSWNPMWLASNIIRDFAGTVMRNPELRFFNIPRLSWSYAKVAKESWLYIFEKEMGPGIEDSFKNRMLNPDRLYGARDMTLDSELTRLMVEFRLSRESAQGAKSATDAIANLFSKIPGGKSYLSINNWGKFSEIWAKQAGKEFLESRGKLTKDEVGHRVRSRVGTPNPYSQGSWHHITNTIAMFSNINKEGIRGAYEAYTEAPLLYAMKAVVFHIIPIAFPAIVMRGTLQALLGRDDDNPDDPKQKIIRFLDRRAEIWRGVGDYFLSSYYTIPLFKQQGKSIFLTIPMDYEGQIFSKLFYYMLQKDSKGLLRSTFEIQPYLESNVAPNHEALQMFAQVLQYYGLNMMPVDPFRHKDMLTERQFRAGGWYAGKVFLESAVRRSGVIGAMLDLPYSDMDIPETELEKILHFPMLGPFMKKFLRVSDRGYREETMKHVSEPMKKEQARQGLDRDKAIMDYMDEVDGNINWADIKALYLKLKEEGKMSKTYEFGTFRRRVRNIAARRLGDSIVNAVTTAGSNEEKRQILEHYKTIVDPEYYAETIKRLRKSGIMPPPKGSKGGSKGGGRASRTLKGMDY